MATNVAVLGAGYAGAGAVTALQQRAGPEVSITWVADVDYHLVLHESHRIIRDPAVQEKIKIPVQEIADTGTEFIQAEVADVDVDAREVHLANDDVVDYDYCLVALGSRTAFFGIEGRPLKKWVHEDKGTVVSVGDKAVAHDVQAFGVSAPVRTFGGMPAKNLKKAIGARWIADVSSVQRAISAWSVL